MSEQAHKYPDEEAIEKILNIINDIAWKNTSLNTNEYEQLIEDINWVLEIWGKKYLGHNRLTKVLTENYLNKLGKDSKSIEITKELDLVICFFQHYIYAFEEFMSREFRDSVIRCGLASERLVNRLSVADNHLEVLDIRTFEDRTNRIGHIFSERFPEIQYLTNRLKYTYSQRNKKAAHDTGAAGILIAKACISEMPTAYMEYLNCLRTIGYQIVTYDELITIVNETVTIGTTLLVSQQGKPTKIDDVLTSLYTQKYFSVAKSLIEVENYLGHSGYNFPKTSLWRALERLCKEKKIKKITNGYIQRIPPEKFFNKEIID